MAFGQSSQFYIHCDVFVLFRVPSPEQLSIRGSVHVKEFAFKDTISTLEQVVLADVVRVEILLLIGATIAH